MTMIKPIGSAILMIVLIGALALLVANDALGRQRCIALDGTWHSGLLGGHCHSPSLTAWNG